MTPETPNGWNEWEKYVLKELERLGDAQERQTAEIQTFRLEMSKDITGLKMQAGIWGAGVALIVAAIMSVLVNVIVS